MTTTFRVYVDESGNRAYNARTDRHFVLSACIFPDTNRADARAMLAQLRLDLRMPAGQVLHFTKLSHSSRIHVAKTIGAAPWLTVSNVIVCKRLFGRTFLADADIAYLYTLRFLLERVSWYVRDAGGKAYVTFAHIKGFRVAKLTNYVSLLRAMGTEIAWEAIYLPPKMLGVGALDYLQLADATASATYHAFEADIYGNTERRYLEEYAARLYRRPPGSITTYGMKMHPRASLTEAEYDWVLKL